MSGRGRGRGRGIPINYPDGWSGKPLPKSSYPEIDPTLLPKALHLRAADKEVLNMVRRLASMPTAKSFVVAGVPTPKSGVVRYSDRYLDQPTQPFCQACCSASPSQHDRPPRPD